MGLAACDHDKIALGHLDFLSLFECEGRRALAEIVKQGVGALWQLQIPGMAELEEKEQRPTETNAIKHLGEDVHAAEIRPADDRTQHPDD
jgi:hypothetical protein